ncbi:MAG TPA: signal peptidase I [Nocardioidaceae bacterium]|nr:signal peptidase I [Nocardioidaceae bacterium]
MTRGGRAGPAAGQRLRRFVTESVVLVLIAVVTAALVRAFVLQAFYVPSGSMQPTIKKGERILVTKLGDVERGDVVVFEDPASWLPPSERPDERDGVVRSALEFVGVLPPSDRSYLVKRLVGVSGDHVVCCDAEGRVTVNGEPIEEPYLYPGNEPSVREFDVVVPEDAIWVMGDHRANSGDSRAHLRDGTAFVPVSNIVGRAFAAVWPLSEMHWLGSAETFEEVPPPEQPAPEEPVVNDVARDPRLVG